MGQKDNTLSNADRIRAMTDEELAEFLAVIGYDGMLNWLKQPVGGDNHVV